MYSKHRPSIKILAMKLPGIINLFKPQPFIFKVAAVFRLDSEVLGFDNKVSVGFSMGLCDK